VKDIELCVIFIFENSIKLPPKNKVCGKEKK
jgi:hypothetical protein